MLAEADRTFRDPAGSVEILPEEVLRFVRPAYSRGLLNFLESTLATDLVEEGHLVSSEVVSCEDEGTLVRHPRVSFISYPWEWPPSLWRAAAEHTLQLCERLIEADWILKDATPLNILFQGSRPIFVDVLSVQTLGEESIWAAYAQFVRTFLLPMIAYAELGWPLQATQVRRDGIEPEELYAALPRLRRIQRATLNSVTLPVLLSRSRAAHRTAKQGVTQRDPEVAKHILLSTVRSLRRSMQHIRFPRKKSQWSAYREQATHYDTAEHQAKYLFVQNALMQCQPKRVLDVGCNSGAYSNLAADSGAEVVAIDTDVMSLERLCEEVALSGRNILPLQVDLARPTPGTGWCNSEDASFLTRCEGHFDTVQMLAVLHHLLLSNQIPMEKIAALVSRLVTRTLIVEWVPLSDPRSQDLLRGRDCLYSHLTERSFREAFGTHFHVVREVLLDNGRILFHMQKSA